MTDSEMDIPFLSPFGSYPNPLGISAADRRDHMHPVVRFTTRPVLMDFTKPSDKRHLATDPERQERAQQQASSSSSSSSLPLLSDAFSFAIGRYDEDRVGMYESAMFDDLEHQIDGYAGRRTIHMGIDLGGPVGTPVYACCDGFVHTAGYNPELGDYGYVVVVQHHVPEGDKVFYALYGHLDSMVQQYTKGDTVMGGQLLAHMGDIHENGGWFAPHVHFQLSTQAPETHDMPGAVSAQDRKQALLDYPDPRIVLGEIY